MIEPEAVLLRTGIDLEQAVVDCVLFRRARGCARLPWFRRGSRFTVSLRSGVVLLGGRKTADFLGDRTSVRVIRGCWAGRLSLKPSAVQKIHPSMTRLGRGHAK